MRRWTSLHLSVAFAATLVLALDSNADRGDRTEPTLEVQSPEESVAMQHGHAGHDSTLLHGSEQRHGSDDLATTEHRFEDAEVWARHFEDPTRDSWQLPDSIVSLLVTREDLVVLDIGSATGYFPVRFARRLPKGLVFGADVEASMVFHLNDRARKEGLPNLISILAEPNDPHPPQQVDLVFICNTYHHIDQRIDYFRRLKKQLRPEAQIAVVDYRVNSWRGPPHKLARENVVREMQAAGYDLVGEHTFLPEQYFLLFRSTTPN